MSNVVHLPSSAAFTVEQALDNSKTKDLKEVVVLGIDQNGDLFMNTSRMSRKDALWIMEIARLWTLQGRDLIAERKGLID